MRVVAGEWRGRRLKAPPGVRPTADRVKEALFSILGDRVAGARVLDLFAGSGALGIEALSRGAAHGTFVEQDPAVLAVLRTNLPDSERATVERGSAVVHLRGASAQYDLVFLDPPYRQARRLGPELSGLLSAALAPGGLAISESDRREPLDLSPAFAVHDERRYGDTLIRFHHAH